MYVYLFVMSIFVCLKLKLSMNIHYIITQFQDKYHVIKKVINALNVKKPNQNDQVSEYSAILLRWDDCCVNVWSH